MRSRAALAAILFMTAAASGCFSADDQGTPSDTGGEQVDQANATAPGADMYIVATDHAAYLYPESWYKMRPETFTVDKGDPVNLTFKNALGNMAEHTIVIDELDIKIGPLGPGAFESLAFTADQAGTFTYYCDVGNHQTLGMEGTFTVNG